MCPKTYSWPERRLMITILPDEVWTLRTRCELLNFEDEVWILRKATGFDTSKMTSHVPYHLRLLTVFYYSVLTCATRANLAQRRKNKITWHAVKDIWTEIGSPIIQCIKWLYPVNVFYATCPVLWRDTVLIHKCCWVPWIYCEVGTFVWVGQELWVEWCGRPV